MPRLPAHLALLATLLLAAVVSLGGCNFVIAPVALPDGGAAAADQAVAPADAADASVDGR